MGKNIQLFLTKQLFLLSSVKTNGRFFQTFVAFSEKLNFIREKIMLVHYVAHEFLKLFITENVCWRITLVKSVHANLAIPLSDQDQVEIRKSRFEDKDFLIWKKAENRSGNQTSFRNWCSNVVKLYLEIWCKKSTYLKSKYENQFYLSCIQRYFWMMSNVCTALLLDLLFNCLCFILQFRIQSSIAKLISSDFAFQKTHFGS